MYKSKTLFSSVLLTICLLLLSNNVGAWERTLSQCPGCGSDAGAVTVDAAGDVIAGGRVGTTEVVKLSKENGSVIWSFNPNPGADHPVPNVTDLAVDSNNDVFVLTYGGVIKVSGATGIMMWRGPGTPGYFVALAVDSNDNVVVADSGFTINKLRGTDGAEMWRYDNPYTAHDVAVDKDGNVAAVGHMNNNFAVVRLNGNNGSEIWQREINGAGVLSNSFGWEAAKAVAIDSVGNVVAAGVITSEFSHIDFIVAKYSTEGVRLWVRTIANQGDDRANAVVVDKDDDVIAAGSITGPGEQEQFQVFKFSGTTGNTLWSKPAQEPPLNGTPVYGQAFRLSVNAYGNIVAVGHHGSRLTAVKFWGSSGGRAWLSSTSICVTSVPSYVVMDSKSDVIIASQVIHTSNGPGKFTVVKLRREDGTSYDEPPAPTFPTPDPTLTPVIFIPGTAGSRLNIPGTSTELWLGLRTPTRTNPLLFNFHDSLGLDPNEPDCPTDRPSSTACKSPQLDVTGVLLSATTLKPIYGPILDMFRSKGYSDEEGNRQTLFPFAYDWRKSNFDNTEELKKLVTRIRSIYPNTKVNIVTHSMGSLLARRYIIENPSPDLHHVDKLITIAAPWLGAPKAILAMETGQYHGMPVLPNTLKKLVEFFPSVHELLPSKIYFDVADKGGNPFRDKPFREIGWNVNGNKDSNGNEILYEFYRYNQMYNFLDGIGSDYNERLRRSQPYRANENFHATPDQSGQPIQDDWRGKGFGVDYYHLYGWKERSDTIVQVIATKKVRCLRRGVRDCRPVPEFDVGLGPGDGTVPVLSALRRGNGYDYNVDPTTPVDLFRGKNTDHFGLTINEVVHRKIISILNGTPQTTAGANFTPQSLTEKLNKEDNTNELNQMVDPITQQAYYLQVGGATSATLTDEAGNLTYPLGDVPSFDVPEVTSYLLGQDTFLSIMPINDSYNLTFVTGEGPVVVDLTKGTDIETAQAIRYLDLDLPANTKVQLIITPEGVGELRYDSNGDGTFDTPITPTVSVTGQAAQDTDAPVVTFAEVIQSPTSRRVTIIATDGGSGVRSLFYSLDGTNFQSYVEPLNLNPAQTPVVYAFAEDNVANRSGFVTYNLTSALYEADVALRPNGDGAILSDDVVQIRRFSNGTHTPDQTTNEFQRADSAPFATRGDGKILSDDVVQARRYQNGTNPKQTAAGPMTLSAGKTIVDQLFGGLSKTVFENALNGTPREVRIESTNGTVGQQVTVNIRVVAQGDEAEYSFILNYDHTKLSNPVIGAGNAGASVRSCNTATAGQINCSVGGFSNNNPASSNSGIGEIADADNLITITFMVANAPSGDTLLTLSNVNASNDAAQLVAISSTNGQVSILNRRRQVSQ